MARFKTRELQRIYEAMRKAATDTGSELYCSPLGVDGPRCPRGGASHRTSYWRGRAGIVKCTVPGSQGHACWAAGQDDAKAFGAIHPRWLGLGIMGSGLATRAQLQAWLAAPESKLPWEVR